MSRAFRAWHEQHDPKQPSELAQQVMENERLRFVKRAECCKGKPRRRTKTGRYQGNDAWKALGKPKPSES